MLSTVTRIVLTAALLYFVYTETGPVTTLALGLLYLSNEMVALWMKEVEKRIGR